MARPFRSVAVSSLALMIGCHLIGGVHDLAYEGFGGGGSGTGSGVGADGGGGAGGEGTGGDDCPAVCEEPCCDPATCEVATVGVPCGAADEGQCDGSGSCAVGGVAQARMFGSQVEDTASPVPNPITANPPPDDLAVVMPNGDVVVAGHTTSDATVNFGSGAEYETGTASNAFVARLAGDNFEGKWVIRTSLGADLDGDRAVTALAPAGDGLVVAGHFSREVAFPGEPKMTTDLANQSDAFVALLDGDGNALWTWSGEGGSEDGTERITAVAASEQYVAVAGHSTNQLSFASITLQAGSFVLLFERASGDQLFGASWTCNGAAAEGARDLVFDTQGRLWLTGTYNTTSCTVVDAAASGSGQGYSMYISELDIVDDTLETKQLRSFGGAGKPHCRGQHLAATDDGIVVAGDVENPTVAAAALDFGNGVTVPSEQASKPFVAKYVDGKAVWANTIDVVVGDELTVAALAADAAGRVALVVHPEVGVEITMPFAYMSSDTDAVIVKYAADGSFVWNYSAEIDLDDYVPSIAFDANGGIIGFGHGQQPMMYGASQPYAGDFDLVVFRTNP